MTALLKNKRLLKRDYLGLDTSSIRQSMSHPLCYSVAKDPITVPQRDWLAILSYTLRDRLAERWMATMRSYYQQDVKRVYYLSMEFLIGRALTNTMLNLGVYEECCQVLEEFGVSREVITELELDAALGNGGLGRLAACFLDSMATLDLPCYGYGIRYEYGMFRQIIENGAQMEHPDN